MINSNLSFTAIFCKHKPLIFLEEVGGLWFLACGKSDMDLIVVVLLPKRTNPYAERSQRPRYALKLGAANLKLEN